MRAVDLLKSVWILTIFLATFVWIPSRLLSARPNAGSVMAVAGNLARMALAVTVAAFLLAGLRVFNATTVLVLLGGGLALDWLRRQASSHGSFLAGLQTFTLGTLRKIETRRFGQYFAPRVRRAFATSPEESRIQRWSRIAQSRGVLLAAFAVVLITATALRSEHAFRELRPDQPEQYSSLLRARALILNLHPGGRPLVFSALAATTSLLSAQDPMEVTRFLAPIVGVLVVLAAGLLIYVYAGMGVAVVAAMYCLGAFFPAAKPDLAIPTGTMEKLTGVFGGGLTITRSSTEFELGLLFLMLALAFLADWYSNLRGWDSLIDLFCCLVLVGMVSNFLLLILMIAAAVLLLQRTAGLIVFALVCYGLAAGATLLAPGSVIQNETFMVLPVAAAIAVGCSFALVEAPLIAHAGGAGRVVLLIALVGIAILWAKPHELAGQCLEYESAARQTREIARRFPRQQWAVAAPVEQLPETHGLGSYEDLAEFVKEYEPLVSRPEFHFQHMPANLFVYVEKKPFQIFSHEPTSVSFSVLADVTYSHYRSPGGRASLEVAALRLCENYRQFHSGVDVFFENDDLRIYHIKPGTDAIDR